MALLDHRAEHVGDRLVERAALPMVRKPARHLRDPMRELVRDHVDRLREAAEHDAVAVPVHHLLAVPKRIIVMLRVVDAREQPHGFAVDRPRRSRT